MGVSYLGLAEFHRNGAVQKHSKFFTSKRAKEESPKAIKEADEWVTELLKEHGTHDCRVTLAKVIWSIQG